MGLCIVQAAVDAVWGYLEFYAGVNDACVCMRLTVSQLHFQKRQCQAQINGRS